MRCDYIFLIHLAVFWFFFFIHLHLIFFQVYAMLKSWRNREGNAAQSTVLAQALRECRMDDAAALLA